MFYNRIMLSCYRIWVRCWHSGDASFSPNLHSPGNCIAQGIRVHGVLAKARLLQHSQLSAIPSSVHVNISTRFGSNVDIGYLIGVLAVGRSSFLGKTSTEQRSLERSCGLATVMCLLQQSACPSL